LGRRPQKIKAEGGAKPRIPRAPKAERGQEKPSLGAFRRVVAF
jgi:hypothetical protein